MILIFLILYNCIILKIFMSKYIKWNDETEVIERCNII